MLFSEYVPAPLSLWLDDHLEEAGRVEEQLITAAEFMADNGLIHFDAHFGNIMTDGETLYVADFGLALADWFELTEAERAFADRHRPHDRAYVTTHLVHSLVAGLLGGQDLLGSAADHPPRRRRRPRPARAGGRDHGAARADRGDHERLLRLAPAHAPRDAVPHRGRRPNAERNTLTRSACINGWILAA